MFYISDLAKVNAVLNQLVTHAPDLIAYRDPNAALPETTDTYGVVMFADISGMFLQTDLVTQLPLS